MLELGSTSELELFTSSIVAMTTDMGTEFGLADAPSMDVWQLLAQTSIHGDGGDLEVTIEANGHFNFESKGSAPGASHASSSSSFLFKKFIVWPGLLHILHNATCVFCESLVHFKAPPRPGGWGGLILLVCRLMCG